MKHLLPESLRRERVTVDLVGCGGTGSRILTGLAELHVALKQLGHPHGLHVTVWDPDVVSTSNIGRTAFGPSDIGLNKANVLVGRVNVVYGLMWRSFPQAYVHPYWHMERAGEAPHFVITAPDRLTPRVKLYRQMFMGSSPAPRYWLDCGNSEDTGQVILGEPEWAGDLAQFDRRPRLPHVVDLFPEMVERAEAEEPDAPSCTLAMALGMQGLSVNRLMADYAQNLLWRFFRDGGLDHHGYYINAKSGRTNPILIGGPAKPVLQAVALPEAVTVRRRRLRAAAQDRRRVSQCVR